MTFKRNGGILFISVFGCSMTFARKGRKAPAKARLPRNPVARVRILMVEEENRQARTTMEALACWTTFAASVSFFSAAIFA